MTRSWPLTNIKMDDTSPLPPTGQNGAKITCPKILSSLCQSIAIATRKELSYHGYLSLFTLCDLRFLDSNRWKRINTCQCLVSSTASRLKRGENDCLRPDWHSCLRHCQFEMEPINTCDYQGWPMTEHQHSPTEGYTWLNTFLSARTHYNLQIGDVITWI